VFCTVSEPDPGTHERPVAAYRPDVVLSPLALGDLLPWFGGLTVVAPVLGHASWHAYRAAVSHEPGAAVATAG
jgi:uncharacterized membrane protein